MVDLLDAEDEETFNAVMAFARAEMSPAMAPEFAWRAKPYGAQPSDYATFKTVEEYQLRDVVKDIRGTLNDH